MFPSLLALSLMLCIFSNSSLFYLPSLSLNHTLFSIPHALLSKQSGLYQDELQPKQAKQKIWVRKSARRRGRILSCQPANWQSPPTSRAPPLLTPCCIHKCTHMHQMLESQLPYVDSCMVLYKGCRLTWPKKERCQG